MQLNFCSGAAAKTFALKCRNVAARSAQAFCGALLMLATPCHVCAETAANGPQPALPAAVAGNTTPTATFTIELNKLEPFEKGCRLYFVSGNEGERAFQSFKLDLYLFQPDGVVGPHVGVDLGPLKAAKRTVKMFAVENVACDKVGSVLINDVSECKSDPQGSGDCLAGVILKSLASGVTLKK